MLQNSPHRWHLQAAQACLAKEKHGEALGHLVFLATVEPSSKTAYEIEFNMALVKWTDALFRHNELDKIVVCLKQALKMYPESDRVLNNVGATLCKLGLHDEAAACFRRVLHLKPNDVFAKENLETVANSLVERWHFRMLNDSQRNKAYKEAISRAVKDGYDVVLDIGSGTGILSMFTVQSAAKEVYACEMSQTMYEMSRDILQANHMQDSVRLIHKKSTDIEVGQDIPKRVSLVVTETLDCGLLGEGILTTIRHAWLHLLEPSHSQSNGNCSEFGARTKNGSKSKVIPAGAVVYGMAVSSEAVRNQSRSPGKVCGVDLSSLYLIGGEEMESKQSENLLDFVEPYTTECLKTIRGGYNPLTAVFQVAEYNFNDPASLQSEGDLYFEVDVTCSGSLDAIVVWFELHLDEVVSINTGPSADSLCWEQAVFPVYFHHFKGENLKSRIQDNVVGVESGSTLVVQGQFNEKFLKLQCTDLTESPELPRNPSSRASYFEKTEATGCPSDELICTSNGLTFSTEQATVVPSSHMRGLNDTAANTALDNAITQAVKSITMPKSDACVHTDSQNQNQLGCRVIDITYGASLCGLLAARAGASHVLVCNPEISYTSLEELRKANNFPEVIEYGPKKLEEAVDEGQVWDLLVADVIEPSGVIRQQVVEDIVFARGCLLRPRSGKVLPRGITAHGMCTSSPFLMANSRVVSRENTLGLDIGRFMNHFQVGTHLNVDLSTLDYKPITEPFELFCLDFMMQVNEDQEVLSLLETETTQQITVVEDGTIQAVPYWFTIHFGENIALATNSGAYWRQAVVILDHELDVLKGDKLLVCASCKNSCLSLKVHKAE